MIADPIAFENQRPEWQRWLNQFCENWIFAFLIAMAFRHFAIEAFRIPTASMEPMLYGDPGLFTGDHVVVDKITAPFTGYHRWDVTVFQFPRPEIEGAKDARPALTVNDERLDSPLLSPLFGRNFVKRMLALPGDTFYFAGGDLHLKQADGTFAIARKPEKIQEALWQDIYKHGAQVGYLPWEASKGAQVEAVGEAVSFTLAAAEATVSFTQPLRNVYVKPGKVHVTRLPARDAGATVEVAMTKPLFMVGKDQGNLWDLDSWKIARMTANDDVNRLPELNFNMDEWVGDVRLDGRVRALSGTVVFHLSQGQAPQGHDYALELTPAAWRLSGDGVVLAQGEAATVGKKLQFTHLDGQVVVALDGQELARKDVPEVDPTVQRLRLWLNGSGTVTLDTPLLQRDLHYCANGILEDNSRQWREAEAGKNDENQLRADKAAENQRQIALVRTQMRGGKLTSKQVTERWGYSPETAITVPPDCYLLMGDNSPFSWDGRSWGYVPGTNLRGRVFAVMFPPQRWKFVR
jgi:signal peptidase I